MWLLKPDTVAIIAVILCVTATVQCAIRFTKEDARLFGTLVFFALSWAVLVPYYSGWKGNISELLPAYQGLLLTLAGGPLRREAKIRRGEGSDPDISKWDVRALQALYGLVLAIIVKKEFDIGGHVFVVPTDVIVGTAFDALGLYSIVQGMAELTRTDDDRAGKLLGMSAVFPFSRSKLWRVLLCVAIAYTFCEVAFAFYFYFNPGEMTAPFKYIFAGLKVAFCTPFLILISREARRPLLRKGAEQPKPEPTAIPKPTQQKN